MSCGCPPPSAIVNPTIALPTAIIANPKLQGESQFLGILIYSWPLHHSWRYVQSEATSRFKRLTLVELRVAPASGL